MIPATTSPPPLLFVDAAAGLPPRWARLQGNNNCRLSLTSGRKAGGIAGFRATASIRVWPPKVRFPPTCAVPRSRRQGLLWGTQDAFLQPRLSVRYRFRQGTFVGTPGNGRDASIPDIHLSPRETPRRRAHTTDSRAMPSRNAVLASLPINSLEDLGFVSRGEAGGYIPERSAARAAGCCSTSNGGGLFARSRASASKVPASRHPAITRRPAAEWRSKRR